MMHESALCEATGKLRFRSKRLAKIVSFKRKAGPTAKSPTATDAVSVASGTWRQKSIGVVVRPIVLWPSIDMT